IDDVRVGMEVGEGIDLDARIAGVAIGSGDVLDAHRDVGPRKILSLRNLESLKEELFALEELAVKSGIRQLAKANLADLKALTFIDGDGDVDVAMIGGELDARLSGAHREKALIVIIGLKSHHIFIEIVAIELVARRDEGE